VNLIIAGCIKYSAKPNLAKVENTPKDKKFDINFAFPTIKPKQNKKSPTTNSFLEKKKTNNKISKNMTIYACNYNRQ